MVFSKTCLRDSSCLKVWNEKQPIPVHVYVWYRKNLENLQTNASASHGCRKDTPVAGLSRHFIRLIQFKVPESA